MNCLESVTNNECLESIRKKTYPFFMKHELLLNAVLFLFSFATYFSVYSLRKPFTVITFKGIKLWGMDYKIIVLLSQIFGYALSKFFGIRFVPSITEKTRSVLIIIASLFAEIALIIFGLVPVPWNWIPMFFNGMPLGMLWGMVFGYLEGRRFSEVLGAGMAISFIVASGIMKTIGRKLVMSGVDEMWMPAVTGALFFPLLVISVFIMELVPLPSEKDIELKAPRPPMTPELRKQYMKNFWPVTIITVILYMTLNALRDFRDNFSFEIWTALGYEDTPSIFTTSETIIGICAMIPVFIVMFIKSNWYALVVYHLVIILSLPLAGFSSIVFMKGKLDAFGWMIIIGVALYTAYLPFSNIIFDRLIATFKYNTNSNYITAIHDAWGYTASVIILLIKSFAKPNLSWLEFFEYFVMVCSFMISGLMILALIYYSVKYHIMISQTVPSDSDQDSNVDNEEQIGVDKDEELSESI